MKLLSGLLTGVSVTMSAVVFIYFSFNTTQYTYYIHGYIYIPVYTVYIIIDEQIHTGKILWDEKIGCARIIL